MNTRALDAPLEARWARTRAERQWLATLRERKLTAWSIRISDMRHLWAPETFLMLDMAPGATPSIDAGIAMYPPDSRQLIADAVSAALAHGTPYRLEVPMLTATGRPIVVRAEGVPLVVARRPIAIAGSFQDITGTR